MINIQIKAEGEMVQDCFQKKNTKLIVEESKLLGKKLKAKFEKGKIIIEKEEKQNG